MYVRCLMNTNVLFKCNLFTYMAEACSISWSSEHSGDSEAHCLSSLLPLLAFHISRHLRKIWVPVAE